MKVSDPDASDIQWPEWLNRGLDTDVIVSEGSIYYTVCDTI